MVPTYDEVTAPGGYKRLTRAAFASGNLFHYYVWPASTQGGYGGQGACAGGFQDTGGNYLLSQANPPTSCGTAPSTRIPLGEIYRIKASVLANPPAACLANTSTNPQAASLFRSWGRYGVINADQGSFPQYMLTADARWNDADLDCLRQIPGSAWEPVNVSSLITTDANGVPTSMKVKGATPLPNPIPFASGNVIVGADRQ